jgi:ribosomal protein L22
MSPRKPADPSQGKPDEKVEAEAADAKAEAAEVEAQEAAQAPPAADESTGAEERPRRRRARKPAGAEAEAAAPSADAETAPARPRRRRRGAASEAEPERDEPAPEPVAEAAAAEQDEEPAAEAPAKPRAEPSAQQRRAAPGARPPVVRAQARYVRTSARKARLVCEHIRGKSVSEAEAILAFAPRAVARDWAKLLASAVANAENNHELVGDELQIKDVYADEGPTLKRYRPRAMGRATPIRKRTSHLTITLTPKE